jgi:hypothetical protein
VKTPNDAKTPDMHPDGLPAFDLDPEHPWPKPEPFVWKPTPRAEKVLEPIKRWLEKLATT